MRLGVLASHPIQYLAPLFRELARRCELTVFYGHRQTGEGQAAAGFGVPFEWDVDLLDGYDYRFLRNIAARPGTTHFFGCDTPDVAEAVRHGGFDAFLVTGWNLKAYWQAVHACRQRGIPIMVRGDSQLATRRSFVKRTVKRVAYPWLLGKFDGCLYVGTRSQMYLRHYGVEEGKLFFSPHCVDSRWFAQRGTQAAGSAWRLEYGIAADRKIALYVGKLVDAKRPKDFVTAIGGLTSHCEAPPLAIVVGEGDRRLDLEALARSLGIEARFLGFRNQTQLPPVYAAADVLCLPSESETWGLVVNEAMACGTPAVVSDGCGCAPDLIEANRTGNVFPMGNIAALRQALERSLRLKHLPAVSGAIAGKVADYSISHAAAGILDAAASVSLGQGRRLSNEGP